MSQNCIIAFQTSNSSHELYTTSSIDGTTWVSPATSIAGIQMGSAPAMAMFGGRLYLAFRANDSSNALYITSTSDGVHWQAPADDIGDIELANAPAMTVFGGRNLSHIVVGRRELDIAEAGFRHSDRKFARAGRVRRKAVRGLSRGQFVVRSLHHI